MRFWIAFAACAVAAAIPLLLTPVLPMADLPEHMAQVTIWKHYDDPCFAFSRTFDVRLGRPYLAGYALARILAAVFTVSAAFKVTVWIAIVLLPLSLRFLLRDPWLALFGFLFAFGYPFYWGFLNFTLAVPLALFYFGLLFDAKPRIVASLILATLVFAAHGLMFVFCALVTLGVAIVRRTWKPLPAIAPGLVLFALFAVRLLNAEGEARAVSRLTFAPQRIGELYTLLFANSFEPLGLLLIAAIAIAIAIARPRITREPARWVFLAIAVAVFVCAPKSAYGSGFLYARFAMMTAIAALFLFDGPRAVSRTAVVAIVLAWMVVLAMRFQRYGGEAREYQELVEHIPANRRVVQFNVEQYSDNVPGPVYWHYGALYQVWRGGLSAWSFSSAYPQIVRYRPGMEPHVGGRSDPSDGVDWPGVLQYDYLLVRGADPRRRLFRGVPATFVARSGSWWLFETPRARLPHADCAPLNE